MLAPELQFMVHTAEVIDEEGYAHRGSKIALVEKGSPEPPQWRLRDFAFAAYGECHAAGLRQVHLGKWSFWAFSTARDHCQEIVVFRKGTDQRKHWNDETAMKDPKARDGQADMFFIIRAEEITNDTPLGQNFNGEWGFWESFYVPLLDEQHSMQTISLMDPAMCEDYFSLQQIPVTCHRCQEGQKVLTISKDLVVTYEVKVVCKDMDQWSDLCNKIGDDMIMEEACIVEHKHLKPGDECIEAYHEKTGIEDHARLIKSDFKLLQLPVIITFNCVLHVADEWHQDMVSLQYKYEALNTVFSSNLLGGFTSMSGSKAERWSPTARLAVNALNKVLARFPDIRTLLDVGCGDMAWMRFFLEDNPLLTYVGTDIMPLCFATNFRRSPKLHFIQTDLSNLEGIEVLPRGCDLVLAKDVFNHMTLPDAVDALKRIVGTRPRFLLTHIHSDADNTGWEKRIDKHLHYTRYDYNKSPFSLPYPVVEVQRISTGGGNSSSFVLYEISPEGAVPAPVATQQLPLPLVIDPQAFSMVTENDFKVTLVEKKAIEQPKQAVAEDAQVTIAAAAAAALGVGERTRLTTPVTELPDQVEVVQKEPERKPIKGLPPVEFRARCDQVFGKYDADQDGALLFDELAALMAAGGRPVDSRDAYVGLCTKIGCDAAAGLRQKDLYKFFEKAPQVLWDEVYRSVHPLAGLVKKGAEIMPSTLLERPLTEFLFEDGEPYAHVYVELNAHMYYGAAEAVTESHIQGFFGEKRLEVRICAPGSFGSKDVYTWRLAVSTLSGEVVPEDCQVILQQTDGRFGSKKLTVKLMKAKKKKWYKVGHISTNKTS